MNLITRTIRHLLFVLLTASLFGILSIAGAYLYLAPQIPSIEHLRDVRLQVPLRVYTRDDSLIAEFGEKRRIPVRIENVPEKIIQAFLAAEDDRFFEHPGVDYHGLLRAAIELARTGEKRQGGSTITMQVARNFFLTREKTYLRKLTEIFLAMKIERRLSKPEILELYLNKIYLGNRAYGIGAAARTYYGKNVEELSLAQIAMIAGLPKAPSRYNPIADPQRALVRRNYVLNRMHELGDISDQEHEMAKQTPVTAEIHGIEPKTDAPYVAEMARAEMVKRFGKEAAYTGGYRVFTTIEDAHQEAANRALREALLEYDRRHGYRGPEDKIELREPPQPEELADQLARYQGVGGVHPAIVLSVENKGVQAYRMDGPIKIAWEEMKWAREKRGTDSLGPVPKQASDILAPGDIIRVKQTDAGIWQLAQVPEASGAFVALDPHTGAVLALVGGFDYFQSKFNRVTQALRQPGSGFKPFIYSAALEAGYTPASLINDAPVVFADASLKGDWRPQNYSRRSYGPTRLRVALMKSRNLVSIRLLHAIGVGYAVDYVQRFGLDPEHLPRNLSLALGTGVVTPLEMATAYSVFANGGYRISPFFVEGIEDDRGTVVFQAEPAIPCPDCLDNPTSLSPRVRTYPAPSTSDSSVQLNASPMHAPRVITPQNRYLMTSMLRDVIQHGTGQRAKQLGRRDIAGKTGTTNDQRDAWFNGFNDVLVGVAWVGFDDFEPLGNRETGGRAALPMWMKFMRVALEGVPEQPLQQPSGLVTVRIDPETGLLASAQQDNGIFETFRVNNVPKETANQTESYGGGTRQDSTSRPITEQLF